MSSSSSFERTTSGLILSIALPYEDGYPSRIGFEAMSDLRYPSLLRLLVPVSLDLREVDRRNIFVQVSVMVPT